MYRDLRKHERGLPPGHHRTCDTLAVSLAALDLGCWEEPQITKVHPSFRSRLLCPFFFFLSFFSLTFWFVVRLSVCF